MSLKNIISTIEDQTKAEIREIKQTAEKQAQEILTQARVRSSQVKSRALENFKLEKIREAKNAIIEKKNENYRAILEKKKEILDSIFDQALEKLQKSDTKKLIARLKKDLPKNGKIIKAKAGGFKFVSETLEIDNSFPALIQEARNKLETKVANLLF